MNIRRSPDLSAAVQKIVLSLKPKDGSSCRVRVRVRGTVASCPTLLNGNPRVRIVIMHLILKLGFVLVYCGANGCG